MGGRIGRPTGSAIDRFGEKVALTDGGCLQWLGFVNAGGYARFRPGGRDLGQMYAHRWAYEQFVGPIPDGLHLDHLCRNRGCVNPAHLEPVTPAENARRAARRITHCPQDHPYAGDNVYVPTGTEQRVCRTCKRDQKRTRGLPATERRIELEMSL